MNAIVVCVCTGNDAWMISNSKLHKYEERVSPRCKVASFQEHVCMVVRVPLFVRKQGIDHWLNLDLIENWWADWECPIHKLSWSYGNWSRDKLIWQELIVRELISWQWIVLKCNQDPSENLALLRITEDSSTLTCLSTYCASSGSSWRGSFWLLGTRLNVWACFLSINGFFLRPWATRNSLQIAPQLRNCLLAYHIARPTRQSTAHSTATATWLGECSLYGTSIPVPCTTFTNTVVPSQGHMGPL